MSLGSTIEWTDATWNPVRGCSKVSPGCKNCYAERFAERFRGVPNHPFEQGFDVRLVPEKLTDPLRWKSPLKIFVNSMSDLFHDAVPDEFIINVAQVMKRANWHVYQVLTKREKRLERMLAGPLSEFASEPNIWWGVSVENQKHGLPRLQALQRTLATVRFLSIEPLLEDLGKFDISGIDWVIVGGESGPGARPMRPEWVRSIRDQCKSAGVPFFFKQWGGVRKHLAGRELDRRIHNSFPEAYQNTRARKGTIVRHVVPGDRPIPNFVPSSELIGI
jgi:protein gp37